jgi:hypothetical protein
MRIYNLFSERAQDPTLYYPDEWYRLTDTARDYFREQGWPTWSVNGRTPKLYDIQNVLDAASMEQADDDTLLSIKRLYEYVEKNSFGTAIDLEDLGTILEHVQIGDEESDKKKYKKFPEWYSWVRGEQTLDPYKKHGVDILALLGLDDSPSIEQVERITPSDISALFREYVVLNQKHPRNNNMKWTLGLLNELVWKLHDSQEISN